MRIRQLCHSVYQIQYHLVCGTKYRYKIIKPYVKVRLIRFLFVLIRTKYPTWYIEKINTGEDHLHILIEIPPNIEVSRVVQKLKMFASVYLKQEFPFIRKIYEEGNVWSVGYFVSTVGLNEEKIKKYIERQSRQDLG